MKAWRLSRRQARRKTSEGRQPNLQDSGLGDSPCSSELSENDTTAVSGSQRHSVRRDSRKNESVQGEQDMNPAAAETSPVAKSRIASRKRIVLPTMLEFGIENDPLTSTPKGRETYLSRSASAAILAKVEGQGED
ncbi:hypothetical protein LTR10_018239 [Elasticomyces elasticus]|uniref:Uncharacterized protein n=1 Tax=Exophiala sideris TaxID=1016849 RepID=A0ABR0JJC1_9EURO|nr:hypothetical protein LTR10_018239 [Elasticomyces elasticus]KAK5034520.1 hypothetical protein LTS07_003441 [Exophiala sideris]KAK5042816.1 hypothetical protein LTR13_001664 [Exophiala sideris]KAK5065899.1 hypothetical protein LTR69_003449 [Exophiala sideris]KAK5185639.1 hypothetical protein LTR44_001688 [Eurotiomycetes sp. CCFEE 6388]